MLHDGFCFERLDKPIDQVRLFWLLGLLHGLT